jgi:2'-hydroxyisoflavone reductase
MVEQGTVGSFNGVGPKSKLEMGRMLDDMKKTTSSNARFTWVDTEFLTTQKLVDDIPIWTPPKGAEAGYSTVNINKAVKQGLTFRPLSDTTRATLDWFRKQPADRQSKMRAGIKPEREAEVLAAWHASRK